MSDHPTRKALLPMRWRVAAASFLLVPALVAAGLFNKTDLYALSPGPATDVSDFIRVNVPRAPSKGAYLITTVSVTVDTINVFEQIRAWVDPAIEVIPRVALVEPGLTDEQQDQVNQADMEQSKYAATVVATAASGRAVEPIPGARVVKVFSGSPAAAALKAGDVVVGVAGNQVRSVGEMSEAIRAQGVGARVRFDVLRDGRRQSFSITTTAAPGEEKRPIVGISVAPAFRLPVEVSIDSQDIVGPSGGLVFALAIADALNREDLTRGYRIAATGTISVTGEVGEIGGVPQKVRAAEHAGADIFLVPAAEAGQARTAAKRIKVYGVRTIQQAVDLLASLPPKPKD